MFFNVLFYLIGVGIVFYQLTKLFRIQTVSRDSFDFISWTIKKKEELGKTPEWKDYTPEVKKYVKPIMISIGFQLFFTTMVLFYSISWLPLIIYLLFSQLVMKNGWYESVKDNRNAYSIYLFIHKIFNMSFIIFVLVNEYYLHFNLYRFIFG